MTAASQAKGMRHLVGVGAMAWVWVLSLSLALSLPNQGTRCLPFSSLLGYWDSELSSWALDPGLSSCSLACLWNHSPLDLSQEFRRQGVPLPRLLLLGHALGPDHLVTASCVVTLCPSTGTSCQLQPSHPAAPTLQSLFFLFVPPV